MKENKLKVKPARNIYKPKYPSYFDKNPLLYPETRPYPFNLKFLNWIFTGGVAGSMLFSGGNLMAQNNKDGLYNPFPPIDTAKVKVPYMVGGFGTGQPERVSSKEALKAIRNAFEAMDIKLIDDVWVRDDVGIYLDGYSEKEKIGFLLFEGDEKDGSFFEYIYPNSNSTNKTGSVEKKKTELEKRIESIKSNRKYDFNKFLDNKARFISRRDYKAEAKLAYYDKLIPVEPIVENEEKFNSIYMEYWLGLSIDQYQNSDHLLGEIVRHLMDRFKEPIMQKAFFKSNSSFSENRFGSEEYYCAVVNEFMKLREVKSDQEFEKKFFILEKFHTLSHFNNSRKDPDYLNVKINIMTSCPIEEWFDNVDQLESHRAKRKLSVEEAQKMNENAEDGVEFIAPIEMSDHLMLVNYSFKSKIPEELEMQQRELYDEFRNANGMTDEILLQKKEEQTEISKKYSYKKLRDLSKEDRKSAKDLEKKEREALRQKYQAMEKLSEDEKNEYRKKINEVRSKISKWQHEDLELVRLKTLQRLEEEVKMYIKWAKSQMGG